MSPDLFYRIKESYYSENGNSISLEYVAGKLTFFQEQIHLIHWQTTSFAEHKATGSLYEYIQNFKDEVIEKLMGYLNKRPGVYKIDPLKDCTAKVCIKDLMLFSKELKSFGEKKGFLDICNLADSLSGEASKTLYLLTLKN